MVFRSFTTDAKVIQNGSPASKLEDELSFFSDTAPLTRVLIFSHISDRNGASMLRIIAETLRDCGIGISHVILSTYKEKLDNNLRPGKSVEEPHQVYSSCSYNVSSYRSMHEAHRESFTRA